MGIKQYTKEELKIILENFFAGHELMFAYYCGSITYHTSLRNSDIDITAVFFDLKGIIHTSMNGVDIFAYGIADFMKRQAMDLSIPNYNLIHADDILGAKEHLIYLNPAHEDIFNEFTETEFKEKLPVFLDVFIEYYDQLLNNDNVLVKRFYHISRIKAILDNYLETGKYELGLSDVWIEKIKDLKRNWNRDKQDEYLSELKTHLEWIKQKRNEVFLNE